MSKSYFDWRKSSEAMPEEGSIVIAAYQSTVIPIGYYAMRTSRPSPARWRSIKTGEEMPTPAWWSPLPSPPEVEPAYDPEGGGA